MNCHCNHIAKLAEAEDGKLLKTANFTEKGCNMNVRVDIGFLIIYLLGVSVAASLYHSHTEILLRQLHTEEDKMDVPKQHDQTLESPFLVLCPLHSYSMFTNLMSLKHENLFPLTDNCIDTALQK